MGWHYQIRKRSEDGMVLYDIVEVYENPRGWTVEGMRACGETVDEVIEDLERMVQDARAYPILDEAMEERGQDDVAGE